MTLDSLIIDFNKLKESIAVAAHSEDRVLLRSLDSDIQNLFEKILTHVPATRQQRILHCEFLLEHLHPVENRQGVSQLICDKILELVSDA